jgi:iron complex outermembrane recepter protein
MATGIPALRVSGVTLLMLLANPSRVAGAVMLANGSSPADGTALNRADFELPLQAVQVTATREPEPVERVPASISVILGDELQARGASDLRTALSLLGGVEGTAGGDNGPAGAVPALWGLREADAFLLVVDGVPWGGAFNPATPSIDLTGVERIEVLRGAAPVMFGATSFVGVIHVIHYAAGQVPAQLSLTGGAPGTYGAALRTNLPNAPSMGGAFEHSLFADIQKQGYREDRSDFGRYHALYRASGDLGAARLKLDGDITLLRQIPSGSLLLRDGQTLHNELSDLVNYNPSGAKLNQERYQLALSLEGDSILGRWSARAAFTRTLDNILRGFLRGEAFADPPDAGVGDGLQADGYSQKRGITDVYIDLHVTRDLTPAVNLTYGVDYLHGLGSEHAVNFGYCVNPDGQEYPCEGAHHDDEIVRSDDKRDFAGLYSQVDLRLSESLDVLAGVRLNHTRETASGLAIDNTGPEPLVAFDGRDARTKTRPSGTVGASWRMWSTGRDSLTLYADYRNTFKPLAVDFGPEAEVQILKPETASSYELGAKGQLLDGRMSVDASVFRMDFSNGLTFADEGGGDFRPVNGGETRFKGVEIESRVRVTSSLQLMTSYAWHDPRYVRDTLDDGTDISGKRIEMSPRHLGGLGMLYAGSTGVTATLVVNCVSARELNKTNTLSAGGYTTADASVGYHLGRYRLQLNGYNLTDRRDPVSESELQGSVTVTGTAGYYRLTGRAVAATLTVDLPFAGG